MEHTLTPLSETILWGLIFMGNLAELVNNIVKMGTAEAIIVFVGFSIVTGSLFISSLKEYIKDRRHKNV